MSARRRAVRPACFLVWALPTLLAGSLAGAAAPVVDEATLFLGPDSSFSIPDTALFQVILEVENMSRQVAFYRDSLGLAVAYPPGVHELGKEPFVRFATPGADLALHTRAGPEPTRSAARLSFMAHDIVGRRKQLLELGVEMEPLRSPAPGVLVTDGRDPEGNVFHIETRVARRRGGEEARTGARNAFEEWVRAYNEADWDTFLGYYAEDPRFHIHEKGRILYASKTEVADAIRGFYASVAEASFSFERPELDAVSARLVLVETDYTQRLVLSDGAQLNLSGTMYLVMVRDGVAWRVLAGDTVARLEASSQ